jgi:DNA processing protein
MDIDKNFPIRQITENDYPETLRNAKGKPKSLYIRGSLPPAHYKYLCVVGSRHPSAYGEEVVAKLIAGLAGYPICIVSGLAIGIDGMAHRAALEAGLPTIAFPGSGLNRDVVYPPSNRPLAWRILEIGLAKQMGNALISKFQPDWEMNDKNTWSFPVRNEIMAGFSHATLVIEAREDSGTWSTTDSALKFGRDVMIVPGSIFSELSATPLKLMKDGAHPVTSSKDILIMLGLILPEKNPVGSSDASNTIGLFDKFNDPSLSDEERKIIERVRAPVSRDDLIRELALPAGYVNSVLVGLEMKGVIMERQGYLTVN